MIRVEGGRAQLDRAHRGRLGTRPRAPKKILAAVLGADVSKSRSPAIHNAAFRALGVRGEYLAHSVDDRQFRKLVAKLRAEGYRYLNVTIPHKAAAARFARRRGPEVRLARAHPHRRVLEQRAALAAVRHRLEVAIRPGLGARRHAVEAARGKLDALSPIKVLERGFSLTQRADGQLVTRASDVAAGEQVRVRLREGALDATVDAVKPK